jgi:hypothetical protein
MSFIFIYFYLFNDAPQLRLASNKKITSEEWILIVLKKAVSALRKILYRMCLEVPGKTTKIFNRDSRFCNRDLNQGRSNSAKTWTATLIHFNVCWNQQQVYWQLTVRGEMSWVASRVPLYCILSQEVLNSKWSKSFFSFFIRYKRYKSGMWN